MARRSRASLATMGAQPNGTVVTEPLIKALEHIPSVKQPPIQSTEDDLTPPPPIVEEPETMEPVEEKPKRRRSTKVKRELAVEVPNGTIDAEEALEPVEEKPAAPKRKRVSKTKQAEVIKEPAGAAVEPSEQPATTPKRKRASKAKTETHTSANGDVQANGEASTATTTPNRKRGSKAAAAVAVPVDEEDASSSLSEAESDAKPKKEKKTPKKSRLAKDEPEYDSEGNEIVKQKRKPKVYPKIEYDIPPVEKRDTTFKGERAFYARSKIQWMSLRTSSRSTGICMFEYDIEEYQARQYILFENMSDSEYRGGGDGSAQRAGDDEREGFEGHDRGERAHASYHVA